jgi:hypothetical protein
MLGRKNLNLESEGILDPEQIHYSKQFSCLEKYGIIPIIFQIRNNTEQLCNSPEIAKTG